MRYSDKIMKEKCLCEDCKSEKILKHFEKCLHCSSEAFHSTTRYLKSKEKK